MTDKPALVKITAHKPNDCNSGLWYVWHSDVFGVVGLCSKTTDGLMEAVIQSLPKVIKTNDADTFKRYDNLVVEFCFQHTLTFRR